MAYAIILDGEAVEIHVGSGFTDANGIQHPSNWNEAWSPQEKVAKGLRIIQEADDVAAGYRRLGLELQVVDGAPVRVADDEPIPLAELKAAKMQAVRDRRWGAENAGVTANGTPIRTDERTQAKVSGALELFRQNEELTSLDWEAQPGAFVTLDQPTLAAIGVAIGMHVQACFTRSKELCEAITAAADAEALAAIDINVGWPD
jgi:hypothetical protein